MKTKIALEDAFYALAEASGEPSVIICDRGTMDTAGEMRREKRGRREKRREERKRGRNRDSVKGQAKAKLTVRICC